MLHDIQAALGAAVHLWTGKRAALDDFYEAFVWAQIVRLARARSWHVQFINAGPANDEFEFRRGPGRMRSSKAYSYAEIHAPTNVIEVHVGVKVRGKSRVLHEFDVVAVEKTSADLCRINGWDPFYSEVRLHAECKYHKGDMNLGIARAILGLKMDCPTIHPMLLSRRDGPPTIRRLLQPYHATYVFNVFPSDTGMRFLDYCLDFALNRF
jgi:hypothetical protein